MRELFSWLIENKETEAAVKIEKIRSMLGNVNTFSLLRRHADTGEAVVELHVGIDDYEDENNRENVYFSVEVFTSHEETFEDLQEACAYFRKRAKEVC